MSTFAERVQLLKEALDRLSPVRNKGQYEDETSDLLWRAANALAAKKSDALSRAVVDWLRNESHWLTCQGCGTSRLRCRGPVYGDSVCCAVCLHGDQAVGVALAIVGVDSDEVSRLRKARESAMEALQADIREARAQGVVIQEAKAEQQRIKRELDALEKRIEGGESA